MAQPTETPIAIRRATPADAPAAARLIEASFARYVAPSLGVATRVAIRLFMTERALHGRLEAGVAAWCALVAGDEAARMVGYAELRGRHDDLRQGSDHLSLLFAAADRQGQGIGRRLMTAIEAHLSAASPPVRTLSVNASTFAVPAYERLGFRSLAAASGPSVPMRRRLGGPSPGEGPPEERPGKDG